MDKCCCVFGHRNVDNSEEVEERVYEEAEKLILNENVSTFLFGSKSQFDDLCYRAATELKKKYGQIRRIYVRAEYPHIDDNYKNYLLKSYEDTYFPKSAINAGRAVYVKRNREIIDKSDFCIVYYDEKYQLPTGKSGTGLAYEYAVMKRKKIINICI